jgi:hypothetical protein
MTRQTLIQVTRTRRAMVLTLKGVVLFAYWRSRSMAASFAGVAVVLFGLQILYNAFQSDVTGLYPVSAVFVFVGLYIYNK